MLVYEGAPSEQELETVSVPPGAPVLYTVMIFPLVAVKVIERVTVLPARAWTSLKVKVVSPEAVWSEVASGWPSTRRVAWAVTLGSGSICTSAVVS